jgi:hypothetical protein
MHLLHSKDTWGFSEDFSREIDFCVWVLEVDGLHIPPFDQHPDGDGSLRALGLDGENWQSWMVRVADLQYQQHQALQRLPKNRPPTTLDWNGLLIPDARGPAAVWTGNAALSERLATLWEQYQPLANEREKAYRKQSMKQQQLQHEQKINLWQDLKPYHARIPTLNLYMVHYVQPLNYLIPPITALMTFRDGQPDLAGFREQLLDAAAGLSAPTTSRRRIQTGYVPSVYTPPDQPVPLYKTYMRNSLPPTPPRPKVHIVVANELKQVVLDHLENKDYIYGDVDLTTVRFRREKAIPGWQLYYVDFEEFDGHKHSNLALLKQHNDGSWRFRSFGSEGKDAHDIVAQLGIKVHDHPLLFLSGGWSSSGNAIKEYELTAHGEIIDNGFGVTRVRLLSEDGQSFEDTVQDGLVLFAVVQDHEVKRPMQAELYNKNGELVWRETVLDNRPPSWLTSRH